MQTGARNDCFNHTFGPKQKLKILVWYLHKHLKIKTSCHVHILEFSIRVDIFSTVCVLMHGLASCPVWSKGRQTDRHAEVSLSHSAAPLLVRQEWGHPARGAGTMGHQIYISSPRYIPMWCVGIFYTKT